MISDKVISTILQCQQEAVSSGNPPFAAAIVIDDSIISSAYNTSRSSINPLKHAEISAIQSALEKHGSEILQKAHLIASNEPCPMCMGACIWSGVAEVSYFLSQQEVFEIRGWGTFIPAHKIVAADDSNILLNGPIGNQRMKKMHEGFWTVDGNSKYKHSIHLSDCNRTKQFS